MQSKSILCFFCLALALLLCACAGSSTPASAGKTEESVAAAQEPIVETNVAAVSEPSYSDPEAASDFQGTSEEPAPVREPDAETFVTVSFAEGETSAAVGYAVPSGEELVAGEGGTMELDLGGGNCLALLEGTHVQIERYDDVLEVHLLFGTMSYYLPKPDAMPFTLLYCNEALSAELMSVCGYMSYESKDWSVLRPYLGTALLHLFDDKTLTAEDGDSIMTVSNGYSTYTSGHFNGKFSNEMKSLFLHHPELATALAAGYDMTEKDVLLSVGIRTEPEVIRTDYPENGYYRIRIIDLNGDVSEEGFYNLDDSLRQYDKMTYEDHRLVRTEHQEPGDARRDGMVETRTYYPNGVEESVMQEYADGTFHTVVYDEHDRQIASINGENGEVTFRRDLTYVEWDDNSTYQENNRLVLSRSVSYTGIAAANAGVGYISTETYDERGQMTESLVTELDGAPIRRLTKTYYENGAVASECLENHSDHTRSYTTYDEAGNQTGYEFSENEP